MSGEWKETTLGEVATEIAYGYTQSANTEKVGPKFLRITDIQDDFIDWDSVPYCPISEQDHQKYKLEIGDVVIARTGNSTGATATVKTEIDAVFASYLIRFKIDAQEANYAFVDFLLRSKFWDAFVKSIKGGSAQGGANARNFAEFPILLPPLSEQKAIAAVLSSFDDKIELLRRQNKTLENIAQAIFKEWFVNFTVNGKKLKIDNSTGLPEGWRAAKLPKVLEISPIRNLRMGQLAPYLDMKGMPTQGHRAQGWYNRRFSSGSKFIYGDTLIARITPCLENGKTAFVDFLEEGKVGWGSTEFIVLCPKPPFPLFYGYLLARSSAFRNFAIGQMTGSSGRQRVPPDSLADFDVVVPSSDLVVKFGETMKPVLGRLKVNAEEIETLSRLRDLLLPKLMKGEIRVILN